MPDEGTLAEVALRNITLLVVTLLSQPGMG